MAEPDLKSKTPPPPSTGAIKLIFLLLMFIAAGVIGAGLAMNTPDNPSHSLTFIAAGTLALVIIAALFPIATTLAALASRNKFDPHDLERDLERVIERLDLIQDRLLISDTAKRIAFREKDRDALRKAIEEDINKRDFSAALVLVDEMTHTYGYKSEAAAYKVEIEHARDAAADVQVESAITELDAILAKREWDTAAKLADKIKAQFPTSERATSLSDHVAAAREKYKIHIERRFLEANQREDVELAMSLLKEMDHYLTPQEADPFREIARGVISKKRQNLGVQFKLAIQDKEWDVAKRAGEEIIAEFPNTKFAAEVRDMLPLLRERAANPT